MEFHSHLSFSHIAPFMVVLAALALNIAFCGEKFMARAYQSPLAYGARIINALERRYDREGMLPDMLRADGRSVLLFIIMLGLLAGFIIYAIVILFGYGWVLEALLLAPLFHLRHVLEQCSHLKNALENSIEEGRATLCLYSGQDVSEDNENTITRKGIAHLTRTYCENVIGLLFYYALFGVAGLILFRFIGLSNNLLATGANRLNEFAIPTQKLYARLMAPISFLGTAFIAISCALLKRKNTLPLWLHARKMQKSPEAMMALCLDLQDDGLAFPHHLEQTRKILVALTALILVLWIIFGYMGLLFPYAILYDLLA